MALLAYWEVMSPLAQIMVCFAVAWAMLTVVDWILDGLEGGDGIEEKASNNRPTLKQ